MDHINDIIHIDQLSQLPVTDGETPSGRKAKPKIKIVSRPRQPKPTSIVQTVALNPNSADAKKQRKQKRVVTIQTPMCRMWGRFPSPLDKKIQIPNSLSEWLLTGHRWFKPELVHQTLFNLDGNFEPALRYVYNTWLNPQQMKFLYADVHDYVSDVPDDVFGIDPDRYVEVRPEQIIQLENPSGYPVFIHQNPIVDINRTSEPPTVSVYCDTTVKPSQLKLALNDAAYHLWGYTPEEWEAHQVHNVEDPTVQEKIAPFFFSMFVPGTMYSILALNLGCFYLNAKYATFQCKIIRKDGRIAPMTCTFRTFLHAKYAHVSQFSFTP